VSNSRSRYFGLGTSDHAWRCPRCRPGSFPLLISIFTSNMFPTLSLEHARSLHILITIFSTSCDRNLRRSSELPGQSIRVDGRFGSPTRGVELHDPP
jgi:hypothetical protein